MELDNLITEEITSRYNEFIEKPVIAEPGLFLYAPKKSPNDVLPLSVLENQHDYSLFSREKLEEENEISVTDVLGHWTPGEGVFSDTNNYLGNGFSRKTDLSAWMKKAKFLCEERYDENMIDFNKLLSDDELKEVFLRYYIKDDPTLGTKQFNDPEINCSEVQGFEKYPDPEFRDLILGTIFKVLNKLKIESPEIKIDHIAIIGSRNRGTASPDSDLDIAFQYSGTMEESSFLNQLKENELILEELLDLDGIKLDLKPIKNQNSGEIYKFLNKSKEYDDYVLEALKDKKKNTKKKSRTQNCFRYLYYPLWYLPDIRQEDYDPSRISYDDVNIVPPSIPQEYSDGSVVGELVD